MNDYQAKALRHFYMDDRQCVGLDQSSSIAHLEEADAVAPQSRLAHDYGRLASTGPVGLTQLPTDRPSANIIGNAFPEFSENSGLNLDKMKPAAIPRLVWAERDLAGSVVRMLCALAPLSAISCLFIFQ